MDNDALAKAEYQRLRSLIGGRYPNGDCQLVALMIARIISGEIIDGMVSFTTRDPMWHFWARDDKGRYYDPLADDWDERTEMYMLRSYVEEREVLSELATFAQSVDFIPRDFEPIFPLRYALTYELLGITLPGIEHLFR